MKKKFSLWLNIVTICLCVCAIAIGVYAATSATLTVSGQIGFTAHGCKVNVSGYVYGHAQKEGVDNIDGMPVEKPTQDNQKQWMTGEGVDLTTHKLEIDGTTKGLDFGRRYFSDLATADGSVTDIVLVIKIENASEYKISAEVTTSTKPSAVTVTVEESKKAIEKSGYVEFEIKLNLSSTANNITMPAEDDDPNIGININMKKYSMADSMYVEGNKLYMDMGTYPTTDEKIVTGFGYAYDQAKSSGFLMSGEPFSDEVGVYDNSGYFQIFYQYGANLGKAIRWYAFAELNAQGEVIATLSGYTSSSKTEGVVNKLTFTEGESLQGRNFYFIAEFSHDRLEDNQSSLYEGELGYYSDSSNSIFKLSEFLTKYQIPIDIVNKFVERDLPTQHTNKMGEDIDIYAGDENAKFWLLSKNEAYYLDVNDRKATAPSGASEMYYLRDFGDGVHYAVRSDGSVDIDAQFQNAPIREAFQINIPA